MFFIGNDKSHGPDGSMPVFSRQPCLFVGHDVTAAVKDYFDSGSLIFGFNSTVLVLVMKKDCPQTIIDYRLIACC